MKEYTVKDLFTATKRNVPIKHIFKNLYLIHNHIVDWDFEKNNPTPTVTCTLLKGWHLAKLV